VSKEVYKKRMLRNILKSKNMDKDEVVVEKPSSFNKFLNLVDSLELDSSHSRLLRRERIQLASG